MEHKIIHVLQLYLYKVFGYKDKVKRRQIMKINCYGNRIKCNFKKYLKKLHFFYTKYFCGIGGGNAYGS